MLMKQKKTRHYDQDKTQLQANYKVSSNSADSNRGGLDIVQFANGEDYIESNIIPSRIIIDYIGSDRL